MLEVVFFVEDASSGAVLMRSIAELRQLWSELGIGMPDEAAGSVFYCGSGWRSSMAWFISELLGCSKCSSYDGGWLEWSTLHPNAPEHPFDTGCPPEAEKGSPVEDTPQGDRLG